MDRDLYLAATAGNAEFLNDVDPQLLQSKAPQDNTALHIAARHGRDEFSNKILDLCGPLLVMKNSDGDTPLHFAARNGYLEVVQILVNHATVKMTEQERLDFLRMGNKEGNTALHEALRNLHRNVAIELLEADPKLSLSVNNAQLSPLHLAVKENMEDVVMKILGIDGGNLEMGKPKRHMPDEFPPKVLADDDEVKQTRMEQRNTRILVSTLIATVTFAAALTVPGGFRSSDESNPGTAILGARTAFRVFMFFDTSATCSSVMALLIYLWPRAPKPDRVLWAPNPGGVLCPNLPDTLTNVGCVCMLVALATGVYLVVSPHSFGLALMICILCVPVLFMHWQFRCPLHVPVMH